ncbi:phosphatases II [Coccomyxa subellipsoidea C-169]|uniref:Phosphatases II n=1 Tax=Coccomyxa subellipsoidea (strain C-169) TaxID=574566 RepID=I0Z0R1_COCSC|nr:phosphatases II [Coccomyxa subellipsoidea C-169]EIE24230.1 phosphatases II [Coccomyxa subellipsoidea C-169]|eukprot:XP_005648774.1 phosphatases II [Coccomyxa subellipsoidea C-169]
MPQTDAASQQASAYPSNILPQFLYLGSYDNASRSELLKTVGITHILNTVPSCQPLYKNSFTYHTVSTSPPSFEECFEFLDSVFAEREKDGKDVRVLVHCMKGVSRSPAIVIGYLMKHRRWRLCDSYKWVKEHRTATQLTPAEVERLQNLEIQLLGSTSTGYTPSSAASSGGGSNSAAPFGLSTHADFQWAWRDAPAPPPATFVPSPIQSIGFAQQQPGGFVFGGGRAHDSTEPANSVAMES